MIHCTDSILSVRMSGIVLRNMVLFVPCAAMQYKSDGRNKTAYYSSRPTRSVPAKLYVMAIYIPMYPSSLDIISVPKSLGPTALQITPDTIYWA